MSFVQFDPDSERAVVAGVLARDPRATEEFARRLACVPRILANRNARLGRPLTEDELHDVAQDTFMVVLRRLAEYEPHAPLEAWMFGICCLQFRDAVRARQRRHARNTELGSEPPDLAPASTAADDLAEAESMLIRLGGVEAQIIRLKHLESLTFDELGARMGLSANTAKTHYYRGLSRLRSMLAASGDTGQSA